MVPTKETNQAASQQGFGTKAQEAASLPKKVISYVCFYMPLFSLQKLCVSPNALLFREGQRRWGAVGRGLTGHATG